MHTRSRNQRSWETTIAEPAKSAKASSSERRVSTSRSLLGSSSSSKLHPSRNVLAKCTRPRSPPLRLPTSFSCIPDLRLKAATYARVFTSRPPRTMVSTPCEISRDLLVDAGENGERRSGKVEVGERSHLRDLLVDALLVVEAVARLRGVAEAYRGAKLHGTFCWSMLASDELEEGCLACAVCADHSHNRPGW